MVDSIGSNASATGSTAASRGPDATTSAQLQKCKTQLGDWLACPSGKTPEGQKIIENLRARISRLEQGASSQAAPTSDVQGNGASGGTTPSLAVTQLGNSIDIWA